MDLNQKCKNCGHTKKHHLPELKEWKPGMEEIPQGKNLQRCKYPGCDCMKFEPIKCSNPNCGSSNIAETGTRGGQPVDMERGKEIPEPKYPIYYRCNTCGRLFNSEELE